jgi:hypothetical protein
MAFIKGEKHTEETKLLIGKRMREILARPEVKENIRIARQKRKEKLGYINSPEARKKFSKSLSKMWNEGRASEKQKSNLYKKGNQINVGRKLSEEWKRNIGIANSIALKGKHLSEETRNKIGFANIGKHNLSEETRKRMSEMSKGKHFSPKTEFKKGEMELEKHPNWQGGKSFEPYTPEFNKAFKLAIRQRDGFMCLKCGMREEDHVKLFGKKEFIHHVDYIKENTFPENCCVLCHRCNGEVNSNRKHWTKFFQSMLSERYGYKYSEDGEIIMEFEI